MTGIAIEERHTIVDRIVDIATVVLISLAALGTAWCSYQSARWSALQELSYSKADAARVLASSFSDRANAHRVVDIIAFMEYERALQRNDPFASFLRARFDPALEKAVAAWLATNPLHNKNAPPTPFAMSAYHLPEEDETLQAVTQAQGDTEAAVTANETSDRYLFLTVLFAAASFLGGIAIKLRRPMHLAAASVGFVIFFISLVTMLGYPIR